MPFEQSTFGFTIFAPLTVIVPPLAPNWTGLPCTVPVCFTSLMSSVGRAGEGEGRRRERQAPDPQGLHRRGVCQFDGRLSTPETRRATATSRPQGGEEPAVV
jgi:hypothetical protein